MTEAKQPKKSLIEKATGHYKSQLAGTMKNFYVKEWDAKIYHRQLTNLRQEQEVVELTRAGKSVEAMVVSIINKALDEDGKPLFSKHDKAALMNEVDPAVILQVANELNSVSLPDVGELEKN